MDWKIMDSKYARRFKNPFTVLSLLTRWMRREDEFMAIGMVLNKV